jgi:hypothetical protein
MWNVGFDSNAVFKKSVCHWTIGWKAIKKSLCVGRLHMYSNANRVNAAKKSSANMQKKKIKKFCHSNFRFQIFFWRTTI